jgi:hypothetical protein
VRGLRKVGGIDFGFRNPFAAIWDHVDPAGVLWILGERYDRQKSLSEHARALPRDVTWYCDPSGATERNELRLAGFTVVAARNAIRPVIAAVNARIETGRLFIHEEACPNLIAEAGLYRYSDNPAERSAEVLIDEHNHALSALRYLIAMLDAHQLAGRPHPRPEAPPPPRVSPNQDPDLWHREEVWTRFG